MTNPSIRASDADRERVVATLQQHVGAGRLTLDEFSERSATAYRARTLGELDALTRDLPTLDPQVPTTAHRSVVPVLVVLTVLSVGALLAMGYPATADAMDQMMSQMGRMCG